MIIPIARTGLCAIRDSTSGRHAEIGEVNSQRYASLKFIAFSPPKESVEGHYNLAALFIGIIAEVFSKSRDSSD
jgi:hypothetical protein